MPLLLPLSHDASRDKKIKQNVEEIHYISANTEKDVGIEHVVSCLCECEVKARKELDEKMQREEAQRQLYQRKSVGLTFICFLFPQIPQ